MPLAGEPFFGFSAGNLRQSMEIALWLPAQFAHVGLKFDFFQPTHLLDGGNQKYLLNVLNAKLELIFSTWLLSILNSITQPHL